LESKGDNAVEQQTPRKIRQNLTPEELARLEKYGSIDYQSAGAMRQK
jgi:hypothetical protein